MLLLSLAAAAAAAELLPPLLPPVLPLSAPPALGSGAAGTAGIACDTCCARAHLLQSDTAGTVAMRLLAETPPASVPGLKETARALLLPAV